PAMLGIHAAIGLGEALITAGALAFIRQTRPDLLQSHTAAARGSGWVAAGLVIALAVALVSPLASSDPDGLERVAIDQGFEELAQEPGYELLPDYTIPFVEHEALTTILAGVLGVLAVAAVTYGLARFVRRGQSVRAGFFGTATNKGPPRCTGWMPASSW